MSQSTDITIANQVMSSARAELNAILAAFGSMHSGATAPSYVVAGMPWLDTSGTPWILKVYDGSDHISVLEINATTNKVNFINIAGGDARTEAPNIGQLQDGGTVRIGSISGTNTIIGALTPAITSYASGQRFSFIVGTTNTSAATINLNSVGAKAIQKNGAALASGDLTAGDVAVIEYDGTQFQLISPARTPVLTAGAIPAAALASNSVTPAKVDTTVNAIGSIGGGTQDIDLSLGRSVSGTVDTSTTTFTFSNPKATGNEDIFTFRVTNGGSQTVNWPASVDWVGGTAPTLTTSGVDELTFKTIDGGTTWVGLAALDVK